MQISQMFKRKPCVIFHRVLPPKQTANFGENEGHPAHHAHP